MCSALNCGTVSVEVFFWVAAQFYYYRRFSASTTSNTISPQITPSVICTFVEIHLNPTWKPQISGSCTDEIEWSTVIMEGLSWILLSDIQVVDFSVLDHILKVATMKYSFSRGHTFKHVILGPIHMESQVTWGQSMQSQPLRAWKLGFTISHVFLSLKYDMDAYMATLIGGKAWDLCCELDQAKRLDPNLNPSPANIFA